MRYTIRKERDYPWGDYGSILTHGLAHRADDGIIDLQRCGPFIPPISFPFGCIIVDDRTKRLFESSDMTGYVFKPVRKSVIVNLDWRSWDLEADQPKYYPPDGEPESFVLGQPHCETTSAHMGDLWELSATPVGKVALIDDETTWTSSHEPNLDFITPNDTEWRIIVVSETAKTFIATIVSARFREHDMLQIEP